MRPNRFAYRFLRLVFLSLSAYVLQGAVIVTLSTSSNSLSDGQSATLVALVNGATNTGVTWSFAPTVAGATIGPPAGPDASGKSTNSYQAPSPVKTTTRVTVTATSVQDPSQSDTVTITLGPLLDVGTGAPPSLVQAFLNAYFRNGFKDLVSLPPLGNVKRLGTTGYVQEFNDAQKSGAKLALATASTTAPGNSDGSTVVQLMPDLYAYYITVGAGVAGLPLYDTLQCPPIDATNSCTYDIFDKSYALFAYQVALATGQNFTIRNQAGSTSILFYTEWTARGGVTGLGRPVDVESTVTAPVIAPATTGTTATTQPYAYGAIYSITSGLNRNSLFTVMQPIYGLYVSSLGPSGSLGLPTSQEFVLPNGDHRQTFEGGVIQYTPGGSSPVIRPPVSTVQLSGVPLSSTLSLNLGQSVTLTATPRSPAGDPLTDRPISWTTSNSRVVTIAAGNNGTAVAKAVGGGAASLTASSEGETSQKVNVIVISPCCAVGDGAPPLVQQSFKDALTRNKITVQSPIPSPATRAGNGYLQQVQSADAGAAYIWLQNRTRSAPPL